MKLNENIKIIIILIFFSIIQNFESTKLVSKNKFLINTYDFEKPIENDKINNLNLDDIKIDSNSQYDSNFELPNFNDNSNLNQNTAFLQIEKNKNLNSLSIYMIFL